MDLYNIGWVCAFTPLVRKLFDEHPSLFIPAGSGHGFQFYKVARDHTFFIQGTGMVEAHYSRLVLKNVKTDSGSTIISYHWHPRLWIEPPATMGRVMIGEDPVGFIEIINPGPEMTIEIRYW
jgi:hypothetical protein